MLRNNNKNRNKRCPLRSQKWDYSFQFLKRCDNVSSQKSTFHRVCIHFVGFSRLSPIYSSVNCKYLQNYWRQFAQCTDNSFTRNEKVRIMNSWIEMNLFWHFESKPWRQTDMNNSRVFFVGHAPADFSNSKLWFKATVCYEDFFPRSAFGDERHFISISNDGQNFFRELIYLFWSSFLKSPT